MVTRPMCEVRTMSIVVGLTAALAQTAAAAPNDRLLVNASLQTKPVEIVSIDPHTIAYRDRHGVMRTEPAEDWIAIVMSPGAAGTSQREGLLPLPRRSAQILELWDGQRFIGRFAPRASGLLAGDEPVVGWDSALFGPLQVSLDRVAAMRLVASAVTPPADLRDHVVLINGDLLSGFVEQVGDELVMDVDGRPVRVPIARIATVRLAGRAEPAEGRFVWLSDGTAVAAREVASRSDGRVVVSLGEMPRGAPDQTQGDVRGRAEVSMADLLAIASDASRLIELASIEPTEQSPVPPRRWAQPIRVEFPHPTALPVLGQGAIHIDGPMRIVWTLPAGALRLRGTAEMPESSWTWGDCVLIVSAIGEGGAERELLRERINAERPTIEFNVPLPRSSGRPVTRLIVTLDPGEHGPVQDRVILRGAMVLLDASSVRH